MKATVKSVSKKEAKVLTPLSLRKSGKSKKKLTPLPTKRTQAALDRWLAENEADVMRQASANTRRLTGKDHL